MSNKKKIFISLFMLLIILLIGLISFLLYLINVNNIFIYNTFIVTLIVFSLASMALLIFGLLTYVYFFYTGNTNKTINTILVSLIHKVYPFILMIGRIIGIKREVIQQSFASINNFLVSTLKRKYDPKDILILLPHCLQFSECKYKITSDINNCRKCGKCQINDLVKLKDKYGVEIAVATGGTLARKVVSDIKPKSIIAVACERDLTSGILDVKKIPVYGIINIRPNGPCFNTKVDINEVEKAIINFINGG